MKCPIPSRLTAFITYFIIILIILSEPTGGDDYWREIGKAGIRNHVHQPQVSDCWGYDAWFLVCVASPLDGAEGGSNYRSHRYIALNSSTIVAHFKSEAWSGRYVYGRNSLSGRVRIRSNSISGRENTRKAPAHRMKGQKEVQTTGATDIMLSSPPL
jgi:hypothetical protein